MADQSPRRPDLRVPIPTLEPDDAFLARLSALAASGAPATEGPRPIPTWRVVLAAASVAAVLIGVAWLSGLTPTEEPVPAPPATSTTPTTDARTETVAAAPPDTPAGVPVASGPTKPSASADHSSRPDRASGKAKVRDRPRGTPPPRDRPEKSRGRGPNANAGDHPNEHATTKSDNGKRLGAGKDRGRSGR